jgi:signal transduction histidine kinase
MPDSPFRPSTAGGTLSVLLLVGDDRAPAARTLRQEFADIRLIEAGDEAAFRRVLAGALPPDVVVAGGATPWADGMALLDAVHAAAPATPVIQLTDPEGEEVAAAATKAGLFAYVVKGPRQDLRLASAVRAALDRAALARELKRNQDENRRQSATLQNVTEDLARQIDERTQVAENRAQQLRMLAGELTKAEERERRRLAQMLHDDLQQMLVAARMHITAINPDIAPARMLELMRHVDDLLDRSIRLSRNLTHRASPPVLYDGGLAPALEWLGRQVEEEHGLEVEVECDDAAEPESQDTRILLYQACRELFFNVVKHAFPAKAPHKRCRLAMHRAGDGQVQVSVSDEGRGFDPDRSKEIGKGDGFGLFSIRERLELIGGRMEIESIPGVGTSARLFAPVAMSEDQIGDDRDFHRTLIEAIERTAPAPPSSRFTGNPIRVLLADDHRIIRASLAGLLRNQPGIEVVGQAGDGQEVIEKARALRPDVIVMDVTMPVVDGVEATRRLTAELPGLSVIALSMHEKEDMQQAMREAGATRYLTKDGPPELLIAAIRTARRKPAESHLGAL